MANQQNKEKLVVEQRETNTNDVVMSNTYK